MTRNYWQVSAGSNGRDYTDDFLKYGIAFVGGDTNIERIKKVRAGDYLVLKQGKRSIIAVGVVTDREGVVAKEASETGSWSWLRDYDGWDLPGYCHVEWYKSESPKTVNGLSIGAIKGISVQQAELITIAEEIVYTCQKVKVEQPPSPTKELKDNEMLHHLICRGLRPANAVELTTAIQRVRLLARYYYNECHWKEVREHEVRTFLIIPFLLALGWSEQQIKIEFPVQNARHSGTSNGRIDLACFCRPHKRGSTNEDCVLILETKGFSQGLEYAHSQGKEYAVHFPKCQAVIASNGYCYKAYKRIGDQFDSEVSAYLNLLQPRDRYPRCPNPGTGGLALLDFLMPPSRAELPKGSILS
ncbi:MAG: hypothetical protein EBV06_02175 [Planctomycetia bacterium]|nr:hypothetical protein [Planctomycetia bacterium]